MAIWTPTVKTEKADLIKDLKRMADSINEEKVQKETGKRLITETEAEKLESLENYDDSKLQETLTNQATKIEELEEQNKQLLKDYKPIPFNSSSNHLVDTGELPILDFGPEGGIEQDGKPSIDNPIEVKGVSGHYDTLVQNENSIIDVLQNTNINPNGMLSYLEGFTVYIARVKKGKKYRANTHSTMVFQVRAFYTTKPNSSTISYDNTRIDEDALSFTSPIDGYVAFRTSNSHTNVMLYEGEDIRTHYTPHQEQLLPIDIPEGKVLYNEKAVVELTDAEIAELGLEKAELYFKDEWKKLIIDEILANTVKATYADSGNKIFNISNLKRSIAGGGAYCNMFKYSKANSGLSTYMKTGEFAVQSVSGYTSSSVHFYTEFTNVGEFKAKLIELYNNGTPVYIVYKLEKPIHTPIKDENFIKQYRALQKAHSYKEVTNINTYKSSEEVADLVLSGNALMSNDIRLSKIENAILSLGGISNV